MVSMSLLTKATLLLALLRNDFQHIHWHASGVDFEKLHKLMDQYQDMCNYHIDVLGEFVMELQLNIPNLSDAPAIIPEYPIESSETYDYEETIPIIQNKIRVLIDCLEKCREDNISESMKSKLDDIVRTWRSECNYKLQRVVTHATPIIPLNFVNTGLDNELAYKLVRS